MSQPQRKTPYVSVNLTVPARDALQQATLRLSADVGRRLPLSVVLFAAVTLANRHPEEFQALVITPDGAES